jgi:hypothetical protein
MFQYYTLFLLSKKLDPGQCKFVHEKEEEKRWEM